MPQNLRIFHYSGVSKTQNPWMVCNSDVISRGSESQDGFNHFHIRRIIGCLYTEPSTTESTVLKGHHMADHVSPLFNIISIFLFAHFTVGHTEK